MSSLSILVFNADGMMLRFALFEKPQGNALKSVLHGRVTNIGGDSLFEWNFNDMQAHIQVRVSDHRDAADWVLEWLEHLWPLGSLLENVHIVAHNCVDCAGSHAPPVMIENRFRAGYPIIYSPDAHCMVAASQQRFPEDVKLVIVNGRNANPGPGCEHEETRIAELAVEAAEAV